MKVRKAGAPTPRKFMGHGICDNIARSCTLPSVTDDSQVIAKQCHALLKQLNVAPEDIRGMGIQVSKLDEKNASSGAKNVRSLFDFMKPQANTNEGALKVVASEREDGISEEVRAPVEGRRPENEQSKLPPLPRFSPKKTQQTRDCSSEKRLGDLGESLYLPSPSQIDPSVFEALPEDIRRSIEKSYAARNQRISLHRAERQEVSKGYSPYSNNNHHLYQHRHPPSHPHLHPHDDDDDDDDDESVPLVNFISVVISSLSICVEYRQN